MQSIAHYVHWTPATARFGLKLAAVALLAAQLGACSNFIDKPVPRALYDFGPGAQTPAAATRSANLPPLVLADIDAAGALEGSAVLYRLAYADAHELRPYAQARWSTPPALLLRQRLREQLGRERVVLNLGESASLAREGGVLPRVLRIELEEFSHVFESTTLSAGVLRLRATLLDSTAGGEKLLDQRSFVVRRPATSADAPGGVRALTEATDAAAAEIGTWLKSR